MVPCPLCIVLISLEMKGLVDTFLPGLKLYGGKKLPLWARDLAQLVECLPKMHEALGAIPSMAQPSHDGA